MGERLYDEDLAFVQHAGFSKSARAAARTVLERLGIAGIDDGLVADLGCGDGGLLGFLGEHGYELWGVDASPHLVERAREVVPGATIVAARLPDGVRLPPVRAVTAVGEVLSYLPDAAALQTMIEAVAAALPAGGLFLFDFVDADPAAPMQYQSWTDGAGWTVLADVSENVEEGWLERRIVTFRRLPDDVRYRRREERHRVMIYARATVEEMLATAGFDYVRLPTLGASPPLPRRVAFEATKR